ncbi:p-loop nucleoside triphosphate hydrolase superfamily protein [Arachis hypogaea]|nr:p-loop nucleoside triphosphate hydrolase superfamily protein [Arachis hypogaea]
MAPPQLRRLLPRRDKHVAVAYVWQRGQIPPRHSAAMAAILKHWSSAWQIKPFSNFCDKCSEIYQETLSKALTKHFSASLLIVDSLLLSGGTSLTEVHNAKESARPERTPAVAKRSTQTTHAGILLTKLGGNPETLLDLSFPDKFTRLLDRSKESPKAIKQLTRLFPNRVPIQLPEYASGLHI